MTKTLYQQAIDGLENLVEVYGKKNVTNEQFGQMYSYFLSHQAMHIISHAALQQKPVEKSPEGGDAEVQEAVDVCRVIARESAGRFCRHESGTDWNWGKAIHVLIRAATQRPKVEEMTTAKGWQPIDSAPRDGSTFLAVRKGYYCWQTPDPCAASGLDRGPDLHEKTFEQEVVKVFFIPEDENYLDEGAFVFEINGTLQDAWDEDENPLRLICWQPLPSPPENKGGGL